MNLTRRRERDSSLPPARARDRGDDCRNRGRCRRHLPGLRLHQPCGRRDRHARRVHVLGTPHRRARLYAPHPAGGGALLRGRDRAQHRDRARCLPAAAHCRAAGEARRVARRSPHGTGGDAPRLRDVTTSPAHDHPGAGDPHARRRGAIVLLRAQRCCRRDDSSAVGALSLDTFWTRHPGGVGERRCCPPRRPVAGRAVARQHAARQPAARHARDPCGIGGGARHDDPSVPRGPCSRRGSLCETHLVLDRVRMRARHRHARVPDRVLLDEVVVPDHRRPGDSGRQGAARLCAHRGGDVPARRLAADTRRARRAATTRRTSTEAFGHDCDPIERPLCDRARRAAVRLPSGPDELADRDRDGPLSGGHHRLRRSDLRCPARPRRRGRLHRLASRRRRGDRLPAGAARGRRRSRAARARDRAVGAARARRGARRRHDRSRGRRLQLRLRQPHLGWGRDRLTGPGPAPLRHQPRADRLVPRPRRQPPESRLRLGRARRSPPSRPPRGVGPPRHPGTTDACRPLERASRSRGSDQRPERQDGGLRHQCADRRRRRNPVRVQLRIGQRRPLQRAAGPQPDRFRLHGRHHARLGRRLRRPRRRAGNLPLHARQVVRPVGELVPPLRRSHPHLHADPEPRGRGRLLLSDGSGAREAEDGARGVGIP